MPRALPRVLLLSLVLACVGEDAAPVELFEGELKLGRVDESGGYEPYALDAATGRYEVEVVRGFQGADMVVLVIELPAEYVGRRVDLGCWIETADWSSNTGELLRDIPIGAQGLVLAPYVILGWWNQEGTDAEIGCEVYGPTRADLTTIDARLVPPPEPAP